MSSGDKVRIYMTVERELYDRLYAHSRDTGEKFVSVLKRALERELKTPGVSPHEPAHG